MLRCKELTYLVCVERERGLSWRERAGIALHLGICRGCRRFYRQMRLLRVAMERSERALAQPDLGQLSAEGRRRIHAALDRVENRFH